MVIIGYVVIVVIGYVKGYANGLLYVITMDHGCRTSHGGVIATDTAQLSGYLLVSNLKILRKSHKFIKN